MIDLFIRPPRLTPSTPARVHQVEGDAQRALLEAQRKARKREKLRAWRAANPEKVAAQRQRERERLTPQQIERRKAYREAYQREWYVRNYAEHRARQAAWKTANPDLQREYNRRSYARKRARILEQRHASNAANK